jgi:hypothetical protein
VVEVWLVEDQAGDGDAGAEQAVRSRRRAHGPARRPPPSTGCPRGRSAPPSTWRRRLLT